ncbi:MAG: Crp/Fnr family transcriptional regulator [Nitrolancea sp.]
MTTDQDAISASLLAELPASLRDHLLADALPVDLPAGSTIYRADDPARCALVITGLIRVILLAPDGRTVTVRYARFGELLGVPTIVGGPLSVVVHLVTDSRLLMMNAPALRLLAETEPTVAWLLAREVTQRLRETLDAVADNAFGSLRQRVARHLLDLAEERNGGLIAPVTQQDLADAVGSARPAVARVVAELRELGLVATDSAGIAIVQPEGLHEQTWSQSVSHR